MTVIKGTAGAVKYGTIGRGGVFVIETKNAIQQNRKAKDTLLVKGNNFTETLEFIDANNKTPDFLVNLEKAKSFSEALVIYDGIINGSSFKDIPFYHDVADYFLKWDKQKALEILSTIAEIAPENAKALKSLAYKFEEFKALNEAKSIYQQILDLRPDDAQSYRDLAKIYTEVEMYEEAANIYKNILSGSFSNTNFSGLGKSIETEFKHLLKYNRIHFDYRDLPSELLNVNWKHDLRIVFEWNDPNVEFDLQFVNPNKKYYRWSHTALENRERLLDEAVNGYHSEEYIIDDAKSGEWMINIENFGNEDLLNPTFLKYTLYKNYGLENETKDVRVIKLYDQKTKVTLDTFFYNQ